MTNKIPRGFTLVEIIVTVAIVAILAAIAVPIYQNYQTRARVTEALVFADAGRTRLEAEWSAGGGESRQVDLLNTTGKPVDMMTGLTWFRGGPQDAYAGYILAEMNLPGFGNRKVLALELRRTGDWHCVGAARFAKPDEALGETYLPASCREGQAVAKVGDGKAAQATAQPTGQSASPAATCPAGQDKVQSVDAKGVAFSICLPACQVGQTRNAQDPSKCEATTPAPTKPCPNGYKEIQISGAVSARFREEADGTRTPYLATGNFVDGGSSGHANGGNIQCHLCRGPKFICERSHIRTTCEVTADGRGTAGNPFVGCMNAVENLRDGSRYVTRSCATLSDIQKEWITETANRNECAKYDVQNLVDSHFTCRFGCIGDNCNSETVPTILAKTADPSLLANLPAPATGSGKVCVPDTQ